MMPGVRRQGELGARPGDVSLKSRDSVLRERLLGLTQRKLESGEDSAKRDRCGQ